LGGGGQKSVGLMDFFGFFPSYWHGLYDLRNTYPLSTWSWFRFTLHLPLQTKPTPHARTRIRTHTRMIARIRTHARTFFLSDGVPYHLPQPPHLNSRSLSLHSTPPPSAHAIKPTLHPFYTLTRWSSSTYKLAIISLNFF
jgi:hypothetical protein